MGKQALEGSRFNGFYVKPESLTIVGLDTDDGPEHPLWDERIKKPLDPMKVNNVVSEGIHTPIQVKKVGDKVLVVAGRQRVRWARAANAIIDRNGGELIEVPVMPPIKGSTDIDDFGRVISENEIREDDDILTKAEKAKRFMALKKTDGTSPSIEDAALKFGVTDRAVRQWLAILEMSPKVKKAVRDGKLTATAASKLQGLSVDDMDKALDELSEEAAAEGRGKISTSKAKNKAKGTSKGPSRKLLVAMSEVAPMPYCAMLSWVLGEMDDSTFLSECPSLAAWIDKAMKKNEKEPKVPKEPKKPKAKK